MILCFLLSSCDDEFKSTANWKELGSAYMLLDRSEEVQYLKLNRLFLNTEGSANEIAQIEDSLYFEDSEMKVALLYGEKEILLYRVRQENKETGVFHSPDQYIYRTPDGFILDQNKKYRLIVENTRTGYRMRSDVRVVRNADLITPTKSLSKVSFAFCDKEVNRNLINYIDRTMELYAGKEAKFYDFDLIFHYSEIDTVNHSDTIKKSLTWAIARNLKTQNLKGGAELVAKVRGEVFYNFLADRIEEKDGIKRKANQVEFVFHGGGQALYDYINVNRPSNGIVQKKPEYTNIENGIGLFSSRTRQSVSLLLDGCSELQLVRGEKTGHLGFVR